MLQNMSVFFGFVLLLKNKSIGLVFALASFFSKCFVVHLAFGCISGQNTRALDQFVLLL